MAFRCIIQHGGKSRELINTTGSEIKKGQLLALQNGNLVLGNQAQAGDILVSADSDVAPNAKGGFAVIDPTMEYEAELNTLSESVIPAGTKFSVSEDNLTVVLGDGFFISTADTQPRVTKVIGKFTL